MRKTVQYEDVTCDRCPEGTAPIADAAVREVSLNGKAATLDFCPVHSEEFDRDFGKYVRVAKRCPKRGPKRNRKRGEAVRAWANAQGYVLEERGRIPAAIIAAYNAAHPLG
jgi:hypothetical protein